MGSKIMGRWLRRGLVTLKVEKLRWSLRRSQRLARRLGGGVHDYNLRMRAHRDWMHSETRRLYSEIRKHPQRDEVLSLFLLYFSAIGAHMVARADAWLGAWGKALSSAGYPEIGDHLVQHAAEEVGHDKWHRADVKSLCRLYEKKYGRPLDPDSACSEGLTACVSRYYELSERTISGDRAYLCLGELYETEVMALDLAPEFIGFCITELGFDILPALSFLRGHVVSDIDHIRDNIEQMHSYLSARPEKVAELEAVGRETIEIYVDYFKQAMELALDRHARLGRAAGAGEKCS